MAIKEFWIQIENRNQHATFEYDCACELPERSGPLENTTNPQRSSGSGSTDSTNKIFLFPACAHDPESRDCSLSEGLVLRRYQPPAHENMSDAWTVPECVKPNQEYVDQFESPLNPYTGSIPKAIIEYSSDDVVIVYFRNNDQRKRTETRMIEFLNPFGGTIKLPTPFNEPFPTENRTHGLLPYFVDGTDEHDRNNDACFPDSKQPVGTEAALWNQIGIARFKNGKRVPPGGTFVYAWHTGQRSHQTRKNSDQIDRFMVK